MFKNIAWYSIGLFLPKAVSLVVLPLYSRLIGPDEYAIIAAMEVVSGVLTPFVILTLDRAAFRFWFDSRSESYRRTMLRSIGSIAFLVALTWMIIAFPIAPISQVLFPSIGSYTFFALTVIRTSLDALFRFTVQIWRVKEQPKPFVLINLVRALAAPAMTICLLTTTSFGVMSIFISQVSVGVAVLALVVFVNRHEFTGGFAIQELRRALSYSWPFIPTLLVAWILNLSDRIFLERAVSSQELGRYGMAYKLASVFFLMVSAITQAYGPRFFKQAADGKNTLIGKEMKFFSIVLVTGYWVAALWVPTATDLVLDSSYSTAGLYAQFILVSHIFAALRSVSGSLILLHFKRSRENMFISGSAALLNIGMNAALIPRYGVVGAIVATIGSMLVVWFVQAVRGRQLMKVGYHPIVILGIISVTVLGLFAAAALYESPFKLVVPAIGTIIAALLLVYGANVYRGSVV